MAEEERGQREEPIQEAQERPVAKGRKRLKVLLQLLHLIILPLLLLIYLLYVVEKRQAPVYHLIAGTPVETFCLKLTPLIWQQKNFFERQALNSMLLPEERQGAKHILRKMAVIRPSHSVFLKNGEKLFGKLRDNRKKESVFYLHYYNGNYLRIRKLRLEEIAWRKVIVYPLEELDCRDLRFLLSYKDYNHFYLHPYIFVTRDRFAKVLELHQTLSSLADEFKKEFGPLLRSREVGKIHVCCFPSEAEFLEQAAKLNAYALINSVGFFQKSDNRLFLYDNSQTNRKHLHIFDPETPAGDSPEARLTHGAVSVNMNVITRHEGAHQLATALGVLPAYEKIPFWLEEGLAQYCERNPFQQPHPAKLALLRRALEAKQLIPWKELLTTSSVDRMKLTGTRAQLAYAQSWLLFSHLMRRSRKPQFFKYLISQRENPQLYCAEESVISLVNTLNTTLEVLERQLHQRIRNAE